MLEIINLKKSYKSKKGSNTAALKGINLKFPDKGLVFILGKSGCGKSTFLNMLGGLDAFDDGEIVINGKSSKDFSTSDFDSYRNTYLGFVFQEFNIIETFTIEKNIELALQLQHKKSNTEAVNEILKKVELDGFGKRKPNELSGGQKQRVAIARALIKDPEIILADEPTGALDSATGKSVMHMLRKLSKEKLVIIVSHDREFAEEYGDRIVELKDGLVISDRTREERSGELVDTDEIIPINDNVIRIPMGQPLDEETVHIINRTLENAKTDQFLLLADERKAEKAYPETIEKVREKGLSSANNFVKTDESKIKSNKKALKLIKAKLPIGDAFHMGASNFGTKKFRLAFTIILSVIALVLFGLADVMASYDKAETYTNTLYSGDAYYMKVAKTKKVDYGGGFTFDQEVPLNNEDLSKLSEHFGDKVLAQYNFNNYNSSANFFKSSNDKYFRPSGYDGFISMQQNDKIVSYGRFPTKYNEVMISDYMAKGYLDLSVNVSTDSGGGEYKFNTIDQLMGYKIKVDGEEFNIVGVYKTNYKYYHDILSTKTNQEIQTSKELKNLNKNYETDSRMLYSKLIVYKDFAVQHKQRMEGYNGNFQPLIYSNNNNNIGKMDGASFSDGGIVAESTGGPYQEPMSGQRIGVAIDKKYNLKAGEMMLPATYYRQVKYGWDSEKSYEELKKDFLVPQDVRCIIPVVEWGGAEMGVQYDKSYKIVGIYDDLTTNNNQNFGYQGDNSGKDFSGYAFVNNSDFKEVLNVCYQPNYVYLDGQISGAEMKSTISYLFTNSYSVSARSTSELSMVDNLMDQLLKIFYITAAVLAFFVVLLLYNFISSSIVNKKKEIGILRAIGARGVDIGSIFIFESLMIAAVILILAFPTVFYGINFLQSKLLQAIPVQVFAFKIRQIFTMSGVTLAILIIATIFPVWNISRRKPIDAILDK